MRILRISRNFFQNPASSTKKVNKKPDRLRSISKSGRDCFNEYDYILKSSVHQRAHQLGVGGRIFQRQTGNEQRLIIEHLCVAGSLVLVLLEGPL